MTYEIENDIPLPSKHRLSAANVVLRDLKPGQSVFFPGVTANCVRGTIRRILGRPWRGEFVTRSVDGGVRVWRV
jgi:hypothetical protein